MCIGFGFGFFFNFVLLNCMANLNYNVDVGWDFLKKQFVFHSKGISYGQLKICSHSISDCLAIETSVLRCFHDWLSYVPRAYLIFYGELQIQG